MTGGGSGGHITPILAVASELKRLRPDVRIIYVGQKGDKLADIPAKHPSIDATYTVRAGKFRRYHGEGWKQLFRLSTQLKNARDAVFVLMGIWQSFWLLRKVKPQIIFTRGGFVSVPVAIGGYLNHVPYITHDSDSIPSLANRIIGGKAILHAVARAPETYPYPLDRTINVGIPLSEHYVPVTPTLQRSYRQELGFDSYEQMIFITGGGNGADKLNTIIADNMLYLLRKYPNMVVVHVAGRAMEQALTQAYDSLVTDTSQRQRIVVKGFIGDLYRYSGAADLIICRGGATNLAEFALQGKPCIVIPAKQLVWNVRNVQSLADQQAVVQMDEDQSAQERRLAATISELLDDNDRRTKLGLRLHKFAQPDAAQRLAELLLKTAGETSKTQTL